MKSAVACLQDEDEGQAENGEEAGTCPQYNTCTFACCQDEGEQSEVLEDTPLEEEEEAVLKQVEQAEENLKVLEAEASAYYKDECEPETTQGMLKDAEVIYCEASQDPGTDKA